MTMKWMISVVGVGALLASACSANDAEQGEAPNGSLRAAISAASPHDVAAIRYQVVSIEQSCADTPLEEAVVDLNLESLTNTVQPAGAGPEHRFADALFVLAAGSYRVCAVPLTATGDLSAECAPGETTADVFPGQTSEVVLVSQCNGTGSGGLDAITVLNDPPTIDDLDLDPGKFVTTCQDAQITATASDPNGDMVSFAWQLVSGSASLSSAGNTATFRANEAGDYLIQLVVTDVYGGSSSLLFPMHVSGESCDGEFCHAIGFDACPSGAVEWCSPLPIDPASSDQARIACETCYGAPCVLESADCAGLGWGPRPVGEFVCGEAYFGFENGCSGDDGRVWPICSSFDTFGYWGKN